MDLIDGHVGWSTIGMLFGFTESAPVANYEKSPKNTAFRHFISSSKLFLQSNGSSRLIYVTE